MTPDQIKEILKSHSLWIQGDPKGRRANLRGADLQCANLYGAVLQCADLRYAYLEGAVLRYANLYGADLRNAYLEGAVLQCANLRGADLEGADLEGAVLQCADLRYAYLEGADLEGAELPDFQIVPTKGSFVGFKKVGKGTILKLEIPAEAQRTNSLVGRKCRAEFVKVLGVVSGDHSDLKSKHDPKLVYAVGEIVRPDSYDPDIRVECTHGIHFFMTIEEAQNY